MNIPNGIITTGKLVLTDQFRNDDTLSRFRVSQPVNMFDVNHQDLNTFSRKMDTLTNGDATFNLNTVKSIGELTTLEPNDKVVEQSFQYVTQQPGKSKIAFVSFCLNPNNNDTTGMMIRAGTFDDQDDKLYGDDQSFGNGYFIQLSEGVLSFVERSSVSGTVVDTTINQSEWNIDTLDGSTTTENIFDEDNANKSGMLVDSTKNMCLVIQHDCSDMGTVRLGFIIRDIFIVAHKFYHESLTGPHLQTNILPVRFEVESVFGTETPYTMHSISASVQLEGGSDKQTGMRYSNYSTVNGHSHHNFKPVFSIKLGDSSLRKKLIIKTINIFTEEDKHNKLQWKLIQNGQLTNSSFQTTNELSGAVIDIDATKIQGGVVIAGGYKTKHHTFNTDLDGILPITSNIVGESQNYTIVVKDIHNHHHKHHKSGHKSDSDSDSDNDLSISVEWLEIQ